jgi:hypothetical protein
MQVEQLIFFDRQARKKLQVPDFTPATWNTAQATEQSLREHLASRPTVATRLPSNERGREKPSCTKRLQGKPSGQKKIAVLGYANFQEHPGEQMCRTVAFYP